VLGASFFNSSTNYLFAGEQFDFDVNRVFVRARYLDLERGRFSTFDQWEGDEENPEAAHKYTYVNNSPQNFLDPSGNAISTTEVLVAVNVIAQVVSIALTAWKVGSLINRAIDGQEISNGELLRTSAEIALVLLPAKSLSKIVNSKYFPIAQGLEKAGYRVKLFAWDVLPKIFKFEKTAGNFVLHGAERALTRGVSLERALETLAKGTRYYDKNYGSYIMWLKNPGEVEGVYIAIKDGAIATVITAKKISSRFVPLL
jgi:RHS repeat-associated protein